MTTTEQAVEKLVMDILARGRLWQQEFEGKLQVRDMGINVRKKQFEEDILRLINEAQIDEVKKILSNLQDGGDIACYNNIRKVEDRIRQLCVPKEQS